jgi:hypothetical protein
VVPEYTLHCYSVCSEGCMSSSMQYVARVSVGMDDGPLSMQCIATVSVAMDGGSSSM